MASYHYTLEILKEELERLGIDAKVKYRKMHISVPFEPNSVPAYVIVFKNMEDKNLFNLSSDLAKKRYLGLKVRKKFLIA
jgi:hypothetical protein